MNGSPFAAPLVAVRCPYCNRLAARVTEGARVEVKCARCGALFEGKVAYYRGKDAPGSMS